MPCGAAKKKKKKSVSLEGWDSDGLRTQAMLSPRVQKRTESPWEVSGAPQIIWLTHCEYIHLSPFFKTCYFEIIIDVQEVEKIIQSPMYPSPSFPQWLHLT